MTKPSAALKARLDQAVAAGRAHLEAGRINDAAAFARDVLRADPAHAGALHLVGRMALQTGDAEIALGSLERARAAAPNTPDILVSLGEALVAAGRPTDALPHLLAAIRLAPRSAPAFAMLADAQLESGDRQAALRTYRKVLTLDGKSQLAAHMVAALESESAHGAPGYVSGLFDAYAPTFEQHVTGALSYDIPKRIAASLSRNSWASLASALDLGCGTGLVGAELSDRVDSIDGIDIAPAMVESARAKGLYRHLATGDYLQLLDGDSAFAGPYDLITAADVFIYVGGLEGTFVVIRKHLQPQGLFAFSVEEHEGEGVAVQASGRFAHARAYVEALAERSGFAVVEAEAAPIRKERHRQIMGRLFLLRASD
jgi:predicted TPR repeat methyltransferase